MNPNYQLTSLPNGDTPPRRAWLGRNLHALAAAFVVVAGLVAPRLVAQPAIYHGCRLASEDGDSKFDDDGIKNGVVVWGTSKTHVISKLRHLW
ncbi:MAG TPA: hypothetical protein VMO47_01875 [Rhodothermales bacterium]|nr:hypothetical protein [Rhodothermales bacterium]